MVKKPVEQRIAELTQRIQRRKQFMKRLNIPIDFWEKQLTELEKKLIPAA